MQEDERPDPRLTRNRARREERAPAIPARRTRSSRRSRRFCQKPWSKCVAIPGHRRLAQLTERWPHMRSTTGPLGNRKVLQGILFVRSTVSGGRGAVSGRHSYKDGDSYRGAHATVREPKRSQFRTPSAVGARSISRLKAVRSCTREMADCRLRTTMVAL